MQVDFRMKRRYGKAAKAFWKLYRNNEDTSQVFIFITSLTLESDYDKCTVDFLSTEIGQEIAYNGLNVLDKVADIEYLETLPKNSFGAKYLEFLGDNPKTNTDKLKKIAIKEGKDTMDGWPDEKIKLAQHRTICHDFMHVLLGTGTSTMGEACTLAFNEAQINQRFNASLILSFVITASTMEKLGFKGFPMWWEAYKKGKKCKWICTEDLYPLLALDIEEVREYLGILPLNKYKARYG